MRQSVRHTHTVVAPLLLVVCLGGVGGCSYLQPYPARAADAQGAFERGDYAGAVAAMESSDPPRREQALYFLELGTFQHVLGDYPASTRSFLKAAALSEEYEERAVISLRDAAAFSASLLINDTALPYRGAGFERVLAHTYLAINFLLQGDLEGARVEILRAYARQKAAREEHERSIARTQEEVRRYPVDADDLQRRVLDAYADQRNILERAGNVYQNLFAHYLSMLVYEMHGEVAEAYIDAKTVYSLNPTFAPVRADLLRFSRQLGLASDYDAWRKRFGSEVPDALPAGHGHVVLLFACGRAPIKEEITLPIPIPIRRRWAFVTISLPKYARRPDPVDRAELRVEGAAQAESAPLMDVEATAIRELWDQAPAIAVRQFIRVAGRVVMLHQLEQEAGDWGVALGSLVGFLLEHADRRSWISLPRDFQIARVAVPAGSHTITLTLRGAGEAGRVTLTNVTVRPGGYTIINLRSIGNRGTATYVTF